MPISFEDLKVWQESHKLTLKIYQLTLNFPKSETYSLVDQIRRSALSVPANIAEAHGRHHYLDKIKFLYNARGSLEETRSHLMLAKDLKYLKEKDFEELNNQYIGLSRGLNSFISAIKGRKT